MTQKEYNNQIESSKEEDNSQTEPDEKGLSSFMFKGVLSASLALASLARTNKTFSDRSAIFGAYLDKSQDFADAVLNKSPDLATAVIKAGDSFASKALDFGLGDGFVILGYALASGAIAGSMVYDVYKEKKGERYNLK